MIAKMWTALADTWQAIKESPGGSLFILAGIIAVASVAGGAR